jgi:hypothetical protein
MIFFKKMIVSMDREENNFKWHYSFTCIQSANVKNFLLIFSEVLLVVG